MRRLALWLSLLALAAAPSSVAAQPVAIHGIAFAKGCLSPLQIGEGYTCTVAVQNTPAADTALDTLTFSSIVDVVHAAGGDVNSGNLLPTLSVAVLQGGATCNVSGAATGLGATGNTLCTVPSGGGVLFFPFTHYVVTAADPNPLTDTATLTWADLCTSGANNCPLGSQISTAASQATIVVKPPDIPPVQQVPTLAPPLFLLAAGVVGLLGGLRLRRRR